MGSLSPFPDLNLFPTTTSSASAAGAPTTAATPPPAVLIPKVEPKLEPSDEIPPLSLPPPASSLSNSHSHHSFFLNFENGTVSPQSQPHPPQFSSQNPNPNAQFPPNHPHSNPPPTAQFPPNYQNDPHSSSPPSSGTGSPDTEPDPNSRAIVPVDENRNQVVEAPPVPPQQRKFPPRSAELVRVTDLSPDDVDYYRSFVRKTRMVFDSLRVLADDMRRRSGFGVGARGDLRAAAVMKERGLEPTICSFKMRTYIRILC